MCFIVRFYNSVRAQSVDKRDGRGEDPSQSSAFKGTVRQSTCCQTHSR